MKITVPFANGGGGTIEAFRELPNFANSGQTDTELRQGSRPLALTEPLHNLRDRLYDGSRREHRHDHGRKHSHGAGCREYCPKHRLNRLQRGVEIDEST